MISINITNTTEVDEIGGVKYVLMFLADYVPYITFYIIGTIVGVLGNILIMGTIIVSRDLHTPANMLIFNLAVADLILSGIADAASVFGVFMGKHFFDKNPIFCGFLAGFCLVLCGTSLMNMLFLSINRYIFICHNKYYLKWFSKERTLVYCVLAWILGFSTDIPNLVGWGGHYYDLKTLTCAWDRLASQSYSIFFPMSSIIIPSIVIMICYIRIYLFARESSNKVMDKKKTSTSSNVSELRRSFRIAKGLFSSFIIFLICWLPYGIIIMIDFENRFPRSVVMYTMMMAHLNSAFNSILYGLFNPAFGIGYRRFLKKINDSIYVGSLYKKTSRLSTKTNSVKETNVFVLNSVESVSKK